MKTWMWALIAGVVPVPRGATDICQLGCWRNAVRWPECSAVFNIPVPAEDRCFNSNLILGAVKGVQQR
jgi:hypothetical protein